MARSCWERARRLANGWGWAAGCEASSPAQSFAPTALGSGRVFGMCWRGWSMSGLGGGGRRRQVRGGPAEEWRQTSITGISLLIGVGVLECSL